MSTPNLISISLSKEIAMAQIAPRSTFPRFLVSAPVQAPGKALAAAKESSRALAGVLLTGALAALLVVADQLIDTWTDGHLLAGWVALWTVTFALLALMAPPLRQWTSALAAVYASWAERSRVRRMEARMLQYAQHDPRVLAEIQAAWTRADAAR